MDLLVRVFATFGPIVLTIMGLAIGMSYPMGAQRGNIVWMIAFVIVGIPASVAAFFASREVASPVTPPPAAARHIEPRAYAERRVPRTPDVQLRVTYSERPYVARTYTEHRNRANQVRMQTAPVYEVRQTVQEIVPAPVYTPPKTTTVIPANTFTCVGFARNADGTWEAGSNTQAFDIGKANNIVIRNQGPIQPGWVTVGGVDLYYLINSKCGVAR